MIAALQLFATERNKPYNRKYRPEQSRYTLKPFCLPGCLRKRYASASAPARVSGSALSFRQEFCVSWRDSAGHIRRAFLFTGCRGEELHCTQVLRAPGARAAARLCQLHGALLCSGGLFLVIVQLLVCLKDGTDFEMTSAPFLPCVFLGAWQKGSCWCSGEKRSVMDWKSVCFTLKSSSTRF